MSRGKPRVSVEVRKGDINRALKIFKKRGFNSGHIQELKDNKEYTKPSVSRRRKKQKAVLDDKVERGDVRLTPTKPKKKR
jgi:small subunit ribosomal protein S21